MSRSQKSAAGQLRKTARRESSLRSRLRNAFSAGIRPRFERLEDRLALSALPISPGGLGDEYQPAVAAAPDGSAVVVWESMLNWNYDIRLRRLGPDGVPIDSDDILIADTPYRESSPDVAMGADGSFVVVYERSDSVDSVGNEEIYFQRFSAQGAAIGGAVRVNTYDGGYDQSNPAVAMDADGGFAVAWTSEGPSDTVRYRRFRADGSPLDAGERTVAEGYDPDVALAWDTGAMVVTYTAPGVMVSGIETDREVRFALYAESGVELHRGAVDADADAGTSQFQSSVGMDRAGRFVIAWNHRVDADNYDIFAQRYSADGERLGGGLFLATSAESEDSPQVAVAGGEFAVAYGQQMSGYHYRGLVHRYDFERGLPLGGTNSFATADFHIYSGAVAMSGPGRVIAAVQHYEADQSQNQVWFQVFEPTDAFPISPETPNDQAYPAVATAPDGSSVVVWQYEYNPEIYDWDIRARRLAPDGTPRDESHIVIASASTAETSPDVAMDAAGNFVVVYEKCDVEGNPSSDSDIFFKRYDASGISLGEKVQVNSYDGGEDQRRPAIAMEPDGGFVIVWDTGRYNGTDNRVYCRRYAPDGSPRDAEDRFVGYGYDADIGVALDTGAIVITYCEKTLMTDETEHEVYFVLYNASGAEQVRSAVVVDPNWDQYAPSVGMDRDGRFVIAWVDTWQAGGYDVLAQRYSAAGEAIGWELAVAASDASECAAHVAMAGGEFVVAYTHTPSGTQFSHPWLQRFHFASGATIGQPQKIGDFDYWWNGDVATCGPGHSIAVGMNPRGQREEVWGQIFNVNATRLEGTPGDDVLYVGRTSAGEWAVILNEVEQNVPTDTTLLGFAGGAGNDRVIVWGQGHDLEAWPDRIDFSETGHTVRTSGVEWTTLLGEAGDRVVLHDSPASDAFELNAIAPLSTLSDASEDSAGTYLLLTKGFADITVVANANYTSDTDVATLKGSPANEQFIGSPTSVTMQVPGVYRTVVEGFQEVRAAGKGGRADIADFYDSPGPDIYYQARSYGRLAGYGYMVRAFLFDEYHAHGTRVPDVMDVARLFETEGDDHLEYGGNQVHFDTWFWDAWIDDFAVVKAETLSVAAGGGGRNTKSGRVVDFSLLPLGEWEDV